jgi:hypothetical protein
MPSDLTKGLDTPKFEKHPVVYCCEETREHTQLFGVRRADVVNVDPAIAPDVVSLLLLEGMREC